MAISLLAMYRNGAITADHLVVECLHMIDPPDPTSVLDALPDAILARMLEFAREYRPDSMVTSHGILPAADQIEAAKNWIEGSRKSDERAAIAEAMGRDAELNRGVVAGRTHEQVMDAARRALEGPQ